MLQSAAYADVLIPRPSKQQIVSNQFTRKKRSVPEQISAHIGLPDERGVAWLKDFFQK